MKHLVISIFIIILSSVTTSWAQEVIQVKNQEATVKFTEVPDLKQGQSVLFLDSELQKVGTGIAVRVSKTSKLAVIQIQKGQVKKGHLIDIVEGGLGTKEQENSGSLKKSTSLSEMSPEDRKIYDRGIMSTSRYVVGGILATYPIGLGIGHAVQGRYLEKGWIFTVGELASAALAISAAGQCLVDSFSNSRCNSGGLFFLGTFSYVGFRIWEAVDAWAVPLEQERRYLELKKTYGSNDVQLRFSPVAFKDNIGLGVEVRF